MRYQVTLTDCLQRLTRRRLSLAVLVLAGAILFGLAVWPAANPLGGGKADAFLKVVVTFCLGKRGCTPGFGVCKIVLVGRCDSPATTALSPLSSDRIEATFEAAPPTRDRVLEIAEDLVLEEAVARKLGFKTVTILKGSYSFDAAKGKFGGVTLNMRATK